MHSLSLPLFSLNRAALLRGLLAGSAWGIVVAGALLGLAFLECGGICLSQIVDTTMLSIAVGVVAIGPVAALRREAAKSAE